MPNKKNNYMATQDCRALLNVKGSFNKITRAAERARTRAESSREYGNLSRIGFSVAFVFFFREGNPTCDRFQIILPPWWSSSSHDYYSTCHCHCVCLYSHGQGWRRKLRDFWLVFRVFRMISGASPWPPDGDLWRRDAERRRDERLFFSLLLRFSCILL